MSWHDLLFMHWPIEPALLRKIVPGQFELDDYQGKAWLGIVPFRMTGVRPRCVPALPRFAGSLNPSAFLELNVRTYVTVDRRPSVLFFSLDAESWLAVWGARRFFHLPYFGAQMRCERITDGWFDYNSRRIHRDAPPASLSIRYRPRSGGEPRSGEPGTLEHFLTERYCLYTLNSRGRVLRGEIHHRPWILQDAECEINQLEMTEMMGLEFAEQPPLLHFARRLDVVAWWNVLA